jgi:hypothetical protein
MQYQQIFQTARMHEMGGRGGGWGPSNKASSAHWGGSMKYMITRTSQRDRAVRMPIMQIW